MNDQLRNHPLNGIGLDALLGDLVREYGWDILAEQLPISCFKNYPSFNSSVKFLRKTEWARERLEDLYLYKFLQYPLPKGDQQVVEPRNRLLSADERLAQTPATIALGDAEFFACPTTKKQAPPRRKATTSDTKSSSEANNISESKGTSETKNTSQTKGSNGSSDPWAKWREK